MKTLKSAILCIILLGFFACQDESDPPKMSVDRYVELLKADKYEYWELPPFTSKDIPALLAYRNERQLITDFPVNGLSSSWTPECALGMYVLWTIESVRARAIGSAYLTGTFPSQNPVVEKRETLEGIEQNDEVQQKVANSYFDWWESNKGRDFKEFSPLDPLSNTEYRWH